LNTYHITVNGKQYTVEIDDLNASPVSVQVDGHPFEVTVNAQGAAQAKARTRLRDEPEIEMDAYVPSVTATYQELDLDESDPQAAPPAGAAAPVAEGAAAVSAPMPGTILDITVQVGDRVGQGDTLCNLEAMKMKSPIRSPGEGTVAQVLVAEGQNVGYGEDLFVLSE
jgi:glutaconyl-CoA decarboxylase